MGASTIQHKWRRRGGQKAPNLVFVHLPKCGGTSLHAALEAFYPTSQVTRLLSRASKEAADGAGRDLLEYRRELLEARLRQGSEAALVSGHWPVHPDLCAAHQPDWAFVTLLRDPEERWLSHFFHNSTSEGPFRIDAPLEAFLETDRAHLLGSVYVRQLGGGSAVGVPDATTIADACRTLTTLDLVGTLDSLGAFCTAFQLRFGLKLNIGVLRKGDPEGRCSVTDAQRERIRELCEPDLRVYSRAAALAAGA